jgi:hypothetical protein
MNNSCAARITPFKSFNLLPNYTISSHQLLSFGFPLHMKGRSTVDNLMGFSNFVMDEIEEGNQGWWWSLRPLTGWIIVCNLSRSQKDQSCAVRCLTWRVVPTEYLFFVILVCLRVVTLDLCFSYFSCGRSASNFHVSALRHADDDLKLFKQTVSVEDCLSLTSGLLIRLVTLKGFKMRFVGLGIYRRPANDCQCMLIRDLLCGRIDAPNLISKLRFKQRSYARRRHAKLVPFVHRTYVTCLTCLKFARRKVEMYFVAGSSWLCRITDLMSGAHDNYLLC